MAFLSPTLRHRYFTAAGLPLAGGKIWSYAAGTTTPLPTFTDRSETTQNANPLILDANGEGQMWLSSSAYKFVLMDSSDVVQWTVDSVRSAQNATFEAIQPLTTKGDLLGHSGAQAQRFPVGTDGHVLTADSPSTNGVRWSLPHPLTTKGDLFTFGAAIAARLPVGTDGQVLIADSAEATGLKWGAATGGGGAENYISNSNAEVNTAGWLVDSVSAAARPSGALTGTSTGLTFTRTTTNPLNGIASFLISKDAVNRQGRLAYYNLTLPAKSKAKVMSIRFPYRVVSGTFVVGSTSVDSDCIVYVRQYNGSTYTWSEPSSFKFLSNSTTLADEFRAEFQTLSDTISADLVFYVATTSASAWVLAIDDVNLGPSNYVYGTPITDFRTVTSPTIVGSGGGTYNPGTGSTYTTEVARSGQEYIVKYYINVGTGATEPTGAYIVPHPAEAPIDPSVPIYQVIGYGDISNDGSANPVSRLICKRYTSTGFIISKSDSAYIANGSGDMANSAHVVSFTVKYKGAGLSSSAQMSDQADTRIVDFTGTITTLALTANTTNIPATTVKDTHGAWSSNQYTVQVPGDYIVSLFAYSVATAFVSQAYVNGTKSKSIAWHVINAGGGGSTILPNLRTGDIISVRSNASLTLASDNDQNLNISRITGPSAIAASETVTAKFGTTSARTINNTTPTIVYENVLDDSHGAYNATTGEYRISIPGRYLIAGGFAISGVATTVGHANILRVFKNGTIDTDIAGSVAQTTTAVVHRSYGSTEIKCIAGDILTFRFYADTTNTLLASQPESNHISIARIGL